MLQSSLSKSLITLTAAKVLAQPFALGYISSVIPSKGKTFETRWWSPDIRGNVSIQHEAAALQPLKTFFS